MEDPIEREGEQNLRFCRDSRMMVQWKSKYIQSEKTIRQLRLEIEGLKQDKEQSHEKEQVMRREFETLMSQKNLMLTEQTSKVAQLTSEKTQLQEDFNFIQS